MQTSRLAAAGTRVLRSNFARLQSPLKINLALTYWCQYRCQTCNIRKKKPQDELTTDEILSFIENNREVAWVDVTGGEIFLRNDIGELQQSERREASRSSVTSRGSARDRSDLEARAHGALPR